MASTTLYLNDQYASDTSTQTVVGYVDATVEKAKTDILNDLQNEVDDIVEDSISSKMSSYSLTSHKHDSYATKDELSYYSLSSHQHSDYALISDVYNKQETDLKITVSIPDLTPYATKEELSYYSLSSHQHDSYVLVSELNSTLEGYSTVGHEHSLYALKSEIPSAPDLSSYYTKNETDNLISGFKNITFLTTEEYNNLDPKDDSVLYVLTDSEEPTIDLSSYVTIEQLNARGYKTI